MGSAAGGSRFLESIQLVDGIGYVLFGPLAEGFVFGWLFSCIISLHEAAGHDLICCIVIGNCRRSVDRCPGSVPERLNSLDYLEPLYWLKVVPQCVYTCDDENIDQRNDTSNQGRVVREISFQPVHRDGRRGAGCEGGAVAVCLRFQVELVSVRSRS
jgi:hypothetical protein